MWPSVKELSWDLTKVHRTPESWLSHCHRVARPGVGELTPEKAKLWGTQRFLFLGHWFSSKVQGRT